MRLPAKKTAKPPATKRRRVRVAKRPEGPKAVKVKEEVKEEEPRQPEKELLLAVRLKGSSGLSPIVHDTLRSLRLGKKFHATIFEKSPATIGMLKRAKETITWGEPSKETIQVLLVQRGELESGKMLTGGFIKETFGVASFSSLVNLIAQGKISLRALSDKGVRQFFRLHPPSGGFKKSTKRSFRDGGELGYRGLEIDQLVKRML